MNEKKTGKVRPFELFLSAFGMGFMPFAPGTWGSAWAALIFMLIALVAGNSLAPFVTLVILFVYGFLATIYYGDLGIKHYGDDPGMIVSDEVCGQAVALFWFYNWSDWTFWQIVAYTAAGFILFRIFDIFKPWPACYFDSLKSKWGILLDDVVAGVYAGILLQLGWYFWGSTI